ncbi:PREDICTED: ankyrin repeat and protein kinase domain-containing protein 1 [Bison bison bison]|uniref:Ankyrin repeat and protein kinase domain-containing protein 1 n=1 Tax=Bison bison bison TaxID=43346 RepID=A0A6P3GQ15_BISBB|nr:PREDICTED: ankyrin repeat and protein kinase domain-containing protein 1 [Bison bison bison]
MVVLIGVSCSDVNCLIEEAAKMEKIKFQHVVSIWGVCRQPLGVVMEFMANDSLEKMLPTHSLGWQLKVHTIRETSLAVNFLRSIKPPLLHLDLKPDFGLSKRMEQSTQMQCIKRSALQGTLSYTLPPPPKMFLESNKGPGPKYDVYSFGIVIWEMLTQKKPYPDSRRQWRRFNIMTIIIQVATGRRPSLHPVSDEWSAESQQMVDLMRRCWDQEPKKGPAFQSPVAHPESEALAGKASCAAGWPGEVRTCAGMALSLAGIEDARMHSGDYLKRVLRLSDSESLVPSDEQVCSYENKVTPSTSWWPGATWRGPEWRLPLHPSAPGPGGLRDAQEHEGWTPLHLAAQINPENVARLLVSHQADPNLREAEGKTLLHVATYFGHVSLVKLPTAQGAELDARQRNLRRPLHLAVERGKVRATQHLLKSGAAPDALDQSGYSPLSTVPARGKYVICKMLLRYGASLELPTQQGWTPLHLAAYKGHLEIIHLLAESQADVGVPGGTNWTPLHLAACHKTEVVVSTLLKCGADPSAAEQSGWTPLHLAVQRGSFLSVIHLLKHRVDVHACNKVGWTPARLAALKGNMAILKVLVKAGAQLDIQDGVSCTPLQLALQSQKQDIITFPEGREPSLAILGRAEPGAQMEV